MGQWKRRYSEHIVIDDESRLLRRNRTQESGRTQGTRREPEVDAEGCATAHKHKDAEQNEKDLLFESADTWQHMEVPE